MARYTRSRAGTSASAKVYDDQLKSGYIYVLLTGLFDLGLPVVKIGMTARSPERRTKELSRGGPIGMRLYGFVSASNARAFEKLAHAHFQGSRITKGGGTEYFRVDPAHVLDWLREEVPRYNLDASTAAASAEYTSSDAYGFRSFTKGLSVWTSLIVSGALLFSFHAMWFILTIWLWGGLVLGLCSLVVEKLIFREPLKSTEAELGKLRTKLKTKYNLPEGTIELK